MTDKQLEANRQNSLQSTGPRTAEGVEAVKNNALRHGLRAIQTVVPGEDPEAWEAHRAAVVEDVKPTGPLELALAEQVAVKLWRLGRVVRFEADLIGIAQDSEELAHAHEKTRPSTYGGLARTDIPVRKDVQAAKQAAEQAKEKLADREAALRTIESLAGMNDKDLIEDTSIYDALKEDLRLTDKELDTIFRGEEGPFVARDVRKMLQHRGPLGDVTKQMVDYWRDEKIPELRIKATKADKTSKAVCRRYKSAIERHRRASGLPRETDLDRIQRYEAHLERGLHKALERLQALQEARGANPTTISLAVVQGAYHEPEMASFGNSAIEATGG